MNRYCPKFDKKYDDVPSYDQIGDFHLGVIVDTKQPDKGTGTVVLTSNALKQISSKET